MKRLLLILMTISLISCKERRQKVISGLEGKPLPSFDLLLTDSITHINTRSIPGGRPLVIFYFNPFCPYCRAQVQEFKNNIKTIKDIQFYLVAAYPLYQIKLFDEHYSLTSNNNIILAQIKDTAFTNYYKVPGVPYMAIYNKKRLLKEVLLGITNVDLIKDIAFEK